jgi:N-hydroxyarylamine O-acetyltransferase
MWTQTIVELAPQEWVDFEPANYMNSTHPDSIFVQWFMVVLQNPSGKEIQEQWIG